MWLSSELLFIPLLFYILSERNLISSSSIALKFLPPVTQDSSKMSLLAQELGSLHLEEPAIFLTFFPVSSSGSLGCCLLLRLTAIMDGCCPTYWDSSAIPELPSLVLCPSDWVFQHTGYVCWKSGSVILLEVSFWSTLMLWPGCLHIILWNRFF